MEPQTHSPAADNENGQIPGIFESRPVPSLEHLDDLLADVESAYPESEAHSLVDEIDAISADVDSGLEEAKVEVRNRPLEQKRTLATDTDDPLTLQVLSDDSSPIIRTLVACNPGVSPNTLKKLIETEGDYVRMVVAHNPRASSEVLDRLIELTNEPEVIEAVRSNPNTSEFTKHKLA